MKIEKDEIIGKKYKKPIKATTIVSILIAITIVIVIGIIVLILMMQKDRLTLSIDGQSISFATDTFLFTEETGDIYISIKDIAPLVGYEGHNGEYKLSSEDTSKMYVEAKDGTETTSFFLNSTTISKLAPDSTDDYENIEITAPVIAVNNKLYVNLDGFMHGFNSILKYNKNDKTITIQTLPYLLAYYQTNIKNFGYDTLSDDFNNQKSLVFGLLVASKETTRKYGVVNAQTGNEIISPRYNKIDYLEGSKEFIVTNSSEKVGIVYSTGTTKIDALYDEIKILDKKLGYYIVKSNSKYGVINSDGETIIHIEYDDIGADLTDFQTDNIKNQYLLYDKVIPAKLNNKWRLFGTNGKRLTDAEYDTLGCMNITVKEKVVNNVLTIGDTEVIVVSSDDLYGGVNTKGELIIPFMFNYIYSITSGGEVTYNLVREGIDYNALDYIKIRKEQLGYTEGNKETDVNINEDEDNTI